MLHKIHLLIHHGLLGCGLLLGYEGGLLLRRGLLRCGLLRCGLLLGHESILLGLERLLDLLLELLDLHLLACNSPLRICVGGGI